MLGHSLTLWHSHGLTKCWRGCGPSLPCWVELRLRTSVRCCHCTSSRRPGSSPGGVPSVCTSEVRSWTRGHRVCCLRSEPVPGREHGRPQVPGLRFPRADFRNLAEWLLMDVSARRARFVPFSSLTPGKRRWAVPDTGARLLRCPAPRSRPFKETLQGQPGSVVTEGLCSRLGATCWRFVLLLLNGSKLTSCISNVLVVKGK